MRPTMADTFDVRLTSITLSKSHELPLLQKTTHNEIR